MPDRDLHRPKGDVRALCVDWVDQISDTETYRHRLYIPRAEVSETDEAQWRRTQEARWGTNFAALAPPAAPPCSPSGSPMTPRSSTSRPLPLCSRARTSNDVRLQVSR
ncbi:hypothetical protein Acsp05_58600 [Actinokineospora sp. NBRC 105648]|nr:hypothetical protein Acsp05_58600 [Actinokineospora sp. NBRC 105648]